MKTIKVKTPAKINLTLEILNQRNDGFHNIQSIMQSINLYDFLTFNIKENKGIKVYLSGNSDIISYDNSNLVYKAAIKFFEKANIKNAEIQIYIEKNIPVAAGLAGGSSNAAGAIFALNKMFNNILNKSETDSLCADLGSDINFCLYGGCACCTSRGELIEKIPYYKMPVSLIKPKNIGISTKEAYMKFSELKDKSYPDNTNKMKNLLKEGKFDKKLLYNSFEKALFPVHKELKEIKENVKNSLMSGSGSTFFVLEEKIGNALNLLNYEIFENLTTINTGVQEINE